MAETVRCNFRQAVLFSKFAERLKAVRKNINIKTEDLADRIGSGRRIIFDYEKDEHNNVR